MTTHLDWGVLLCNTMVTMAERERTTAWWNSSEVLEARERSGYDQGRGSLRQLLVELLDVLDEREVEALALPECPKSDSFRLAAEEYVDTGQVRKQSAQSAIEQMLDLGAEPDQLKTIFGETEVTRVVAIWPAWRQVAFTAARHGATGDEIKALVAAAVTGRRIHWPEIAACLAAHGFEFETPADRRVNPAMRERILELHGSGLSVTKTAVEAGCSRQYAQKIVSAARVA